MHAVHFSQLLSESFLAALEMQILFTKLIIRFTWNFSFCSVALRFVFLTQQQRLNCVDVIISTRTASAAARTPVDCSELHQQPVDAVLRSTFVRQLCYKLSSVVTFTFIQIFDQNFVSFTEQRQSCCVCLIQRQNSRYFRCPVWKKKSW